MLFVPNVMEVCTYIDTHLISTIIYAYWRLIKLYTFKSMRRWKTTINDAVVNSTLTHKLCQHCFLLGAATLNFYHVSEPSIFMKIYFDDFSICHSGMLSSTYQLGLSADVMGCYTRKYTFNELHTYTIYVNIILNRYSCEIVLPYLL